MHFQSSSTTNDQQCSLLGRRKQLCGIKKEINTELVLFDYSKLVSGTIRPKSPASREPVESDAFKEVALRLTDCGIGFNQARIYLALLSASPSSVNSISRFLGIHRVDVYRKIRELETIGLVELHLGFPRTYSAVNPRNALSILVGMQEERVGVVKRQTTELLTALQSIKLPSFDFIGANVGIKNVDSAYRLGIGHEAYISELNRLIGSSRREVLRIVSARALMRARWLPFSKEYASAKARGVHIRIISQIDAENIRDAHKLFRYAELRQIDDSSSIRLRLTVVDRAVSIMSAGFEDRIRTLDPKRNAFLVLDNAAFAEGFARFFESLWRVSQRPPHMS